MNSDFFWVTYETIRQWLWILTTPLVKTIGKLPHLYPKFAVHGKPYIILYSYSGGLYPVVFLSARACVHCDHHSLHNDLHPHSQHIEVTLAVYILRSYRLPVPVHTGIITPSTTISVPQHIKAGTKWWTSCRHILGWKSFYIHYHIEAETNWKPFSSDIFKCILLNTNVWILIKISLMFVPKGPINNILAFAQIMAWCQPVNKPFSEPMIDSYMHHLASMSHTWSLHLLSKGLNDDRSALVKVMVWCRTGEKPLPEPLMTKFHDTIWRQ